MIEFFVTVCFCNFVKTKIKIKSKVNLLEQRNLNCRFRNSVFQVYLVIADFLKTKTTKIK